MEEEEIDLNKEYKACTEVDEDDALTVEVLLGIDRIGAEIGLVEEMFRTREIGGYEALERLKVLFELVTPLTDKIRTRI